MHPFSRPAGVDPSGITLIANADNRFGFRLFDQILRADANVNGCISPVSIALALQMTYNGAQGPTQTGMAQALGLEQWSLDELNQSNRGLLAGFAAASQPPAVNSATPPVVPSPSAPAQAGSGSPAPLPQLDVANSLWLRNREEIRPDFLQRAQQFYRAQISDLHGAPQTINAWVSQHTNHKITQIVTAQDVAGIEAALVNAVYFKGLWQKPFDSKQTVEKPFHPARGAAQMCQMMKTDGKFGYYQDTAFQMVSLPYAGERLDMLLLLPNAKTALTTIVHQATPENWQKWTTSLHVQSGIVELPRFRAEFGVELKEPLTKMGMNLAFEPAANFAGMSRHPLYISKVVHKTFVDVNEQGTEAAAATAVLMPRGLAAHPQPPFHILCDRPFFYAIRDRQTGALLFIGIKG